MQNPLLTELMNMFVFMPATLICVCGFMNGQSGWLLPVLGDFHTVVELLVTVWMAGG